MTLGSIAHSSVLLVLKQWQLPRASRWTVLSLPLERIAEKHCARRDLRDSYAVWKCCSLWKNLWKTRACPRSAPITSQPTHRSFFSMHIRITTGGVRTVRKIFSLFWVYRGHFHEKSYTINKKCRRCKEFAQVFRQKSRGIYPGVNWIYTFSK